MKRLEEMLDQFVSICLEVFGPERVEAIIQHGSTVKGGAIYGYSDIDFQLYLTPDCFDQEHRLLDDLCFAFQDRFGPLRWQETGFNYGQVYFYDRHALPDWWTGPPRDTCRSLMGELPAEAEATDERLRMASVRLLKELPDYVGSEVVNFADCGEQQLPRRVRLLGTTITPTVFALLAHDSEDALRLWALSKFEALDLLHRRYPNEDGPRLALAFYEGVKGLFNGAYVPQEARQTFRRGVMFLRWAQQIGANLHATSIPPTPGRSNT